MYGNAPRVMSADPSAINIGRVSLDTRKRQIAHPSNEVDTNIIKRPRIIPKIVGE
jgi:hypothetical protein